MTMPGQRCCTCNTSQQQPDTLLHKSRLQELGASIEFDGEMSVLMLMLEEEVTNNRATSTSFTVSLSRQTILALHPHVVDCMRDDALHCTILHGLRWVGERYYGRSAKDLVGGGPLPMTVLDLYLPSLAKPPLAPDVDQDFYNAIACAVSCVLAMVQPTECLALSLSLTHTFLTGATGAASLAACSNIDALPLVPAAPAAVAPPSAAGAAVCCSHGPLFNLPGVGLAITDW
jgi:hypothetical protein